MERNKTFANLKRGDFFDKKHVFWEYTRVKGIKRTKIVVFNDGTVMGARELDHLPGTFGEPYEVKSPHRY